MSEPLTRDHRTARRRRGAGVTATALVLVAAVVVGIVLVFRFVDAERARDLRAWQVRLGIVADSRAAAVHGWLARQQAALGELAGNTAIRLLLTQVKLAGGDLAKVPNGLAQVDYLSTLVALSARQSGFEAADGGSELPVKTPRRGGAGMAILGLDGTAVISTRGLPITEDEVAKFIAGAARGKPAICDLFMDGAGRPALALLEPIYAVQANPSPDQQVGWVLGVKQVGAELYPLLRQPGAVEASAEPLLVERRGASVAFLSPLRDGKAPLGFTLALNTPDLAEAAALAAPGGFGVMRDYRDRLVLYTSRAIAGVPWVLVYKVDRDEALGGTDRREQRLLIMLLLAIGLVSAGVVALWRHGASRRAAEAAERYRRLAERFDQHSRFLRLVADAQPNAIAIVDAAGVLRFANRKAAEDAGIAPAEIVGKPLAAALGPAEAKRYTWLNRAALDDGKPVSSVHHVTRDGVERVLQSRHVPLAETADMPRGVLMVEEDLTAAITERERRERTLDQLVRGLIEIVDRRDPFAAHHSARVAAIARMIATEMGLEPRLIETAEIAGSLMNLGKILISPDLLTRPGRLSDDEMAQVRDSLEATARFLEGIEFDGPVVETLRQVQEHVDGSGRPLGLVGDAILPTARVVAVANALVALLSPRAHRTGLDVDRAIDTLLGLAGSRYDRGVVAALVSYLDNKGGRQAWANLALEPATVIGLAARGR